MTAKECIAKYATEAFSPPQNTYTVHSPFEIQLTKAVMSAYAKHVLDNDAIGWDELADILCDAICEAIGDHAFCSWCDEIRNL